MAPPYDFAKEAPRHRLERRVYPEVNVSGFPHHDQEVAFFTQVAAILRPDDVVLDFGAGRGEFMDNDPSLHRRWLQNFRGRCAHETRLRQEGYFRPEPIRKSWEAHLSGRSDEQGRLWSVLMFQSWLEAQREGSGA